MRYFLRRLGFYLFTLWGAITLNFFMPRLIPGNPAEAFLVRMQGQVQDPRILKALMIDFGVNTTEPLWQQYLDYLNNLIHGNLGLSISHFPTPVVEVIAQCLPWTIALVGVSTIISFILGITLGIVFAWKRGSWLDQGLMPTLLFFAALPSFWVALVLLYFLAFQLGWFPLQGGYDTNLTIGLSWDFFTSTIYYSFLPAVSIVLFSYAGWVLGMRNLMILNLKEDYIVMAEAKGLPQRQVMFSYAARNAMLPTVTGLALALGSVVGGSVLVENIFSYPGMGAEFVKAIGNLDYASIQSFSMFIILATLMANFIVDLLYIMLDPRVRRA